MTGVTINGIAEGLKVAGCGSVSWILQDDNKDNIEIIIEQVLHISGLPTQIIWPQQVAEQTGHIVNGLYAEKDEAHLVFGGLKFTKNIMLTVAFPSVILSMEFPNSRHTTWSFIKMVEKQIIWHCHNGLF